MSSEIELLKLGAKCPDLRPHVLRILQATRSKRAGSSLPFVDQIGDGHPISWPNNLIFTAMFMHRVLGYEIRYIPNVRLHTNGWEVIVHFVRQDHEKEEFRNILESISQHKVLMTLEADIAGEGPEELWKVRFQDEKPETRP